jgi:(2R)-3-sulfolactate dehydrogenase (NADP+)
VDALIEVAAHRLKGDVAAALAPFADAGRAHGIEAEDADLAARWIVQAERLGLTGFGVDMLLRDLARVAGSGPGAPATRDARDAAADPATGRESAVDAGATGSVAIDGIDATGAPGPLALAAAVRIAAASTAAHGIGLVGVRNVGALGVLGLAARSLAEAGAVALVSAQAPAMVAPWGGSSPAIGTNPLAFAAPRTGGSPLVADFATSRITLAELRRRREAGEPLPEGVALDAQGRPTLAADAAAALLPEGRLGSLTGLLVEVIAGAAVGGRAPSGEAAAGRGAVIIAFDPARAGGSGIAETCAEIAAEWRAAGGHVPGRFDALPQGHEDLEGAVALTQHQYDALLARGAEGAS